MSFTECYVPKNKKNKYKNRLFRQKYQIICFYCLINFVNTTGSICGRLTSLSFCICTLSTWDEIFSSLSGSLRSFNTKIRSNLDKMVVSKSIFSSAFLRSSYRPKVGLAAAKTDVREFKTVVMPLTRKRMSEF